MTEQQFTDDATTGQGEWFCPCPGCGGTIRADPGASVPWIYTCQTSCSGAWDLLRDGYGVSGPSLWDGPQATPECGWTEGDPKSGRRSNRPPEPLPSAGQFAAWERVRKRTPDLLAWLDARGLEGAAGKWHWGYGQPHSGRPPGLIIPFPPRRPVTYRVRYWPELWEDAGGKVVKYAQPAGHPLRLWPYIPQGGFVVLCEGELDAALMWRHGFRAVATPGMQVKKELAEELGQAVDEVAVIFDTGDKAAKAAARAVELIRNSRGFMQGEVKVWSVRLPMPEKDDDIGSWFTKYGRTGTELRRLINKQRPKEK